MPKLSLDETFEQQSGISVAVKTELDAIMSGFGYNILNALVTDIIPDSKVKDAMNDINAAQRAQVAAQARGEADKILKVKQAEAEAESKALQGKGIAAERQAIIDGLRASIENFRESVPGATAEDVMALVLLTQYFDTLKDIGTKRRQQHHLPAQQPRRRQRLHDADPRRPARRPHPHPPGPDAPAPSSPPAPTTPQPHPQAPPAPPTPTPAPSTTTTQTQRGAHPSAPRSRLLPNEPLRSR